MKNKKYKVYFTEGAMFDHLMKAGTIIIFPEKSKWNDFTHETRFVFVVYEEEGVVFRDKIRCSFLSSENEPKKTIQDLINASDKNAVLADKLGSYYTMQYDMDAYRRIVKHFGISNAKNLLLSLNDLVAIQEFDKKNNWYKNAIESDAFNLSFVRETDSYFAYKNAHLVLGGLDKETSGEISNSLNIEFKLNNFENSHKIQFEFERYGLLPKNTAILIGKNGTGKSQALYNIVESALTGSKKLTDNEGYRPLISRIIAIAAPGETSRTFPKLRKTGRIPYKKFSLGRKKKGSQNEGLADSIIQLARSEQHVAGFKRWDIFLQTLKSAIDIEKIFLPYSKGFISENTPKKFTAANVAHLSERREQSFLEACKKIDKKADPVILSENKFSPLSSGQITFINFIATLCLEIDQPPIYDPV